MVHILFQALFSKKMEKKVSQNFQQTDILQIL